MRYLTLILIAVLFIGCISTKRTTERNYVKVYTVPAGEHYSVKKVDLVDSPEAGTIFTNKTWWWPVPEKNGWSKVTGIGNLQSEKKEGSRIVYMIKDIKYNGLIVTAGLLGWYVCDNGYCEHNPKLISIDTIFYEDLNKVRFDYETGFNGFDEVYLKWRKTKRGKRSGQEKYYAKPISHIRGIKYRNHPYIGGTYTIEHDWIVKIEHKTQYK